MTKPSATNQEAFDARSRRSAPPPDPADRLVTQAPKRDREIEIAKARARNEKRFGTPAAAALTELALTWRSAFLVVGLLRRLVFLAGDFFAGCLLGRSLLRRAAARPGAGRRAEPESSLEPTTSVTLTAAALATSRRRR